LNAVADAHDVVAVVTQPDRPAGRGHKLVATPVKRAAQALGLRVLTPEKLKPFVAEAHALEADAFVVASYGKIVPQALLDLVPVAFNVHPSLLPLYRGATPLQSAIRDGRTETGVTIIAMDAGMDTGDVLLQERIPLGPDETYGELHDRLARRGAELVLEALRRYADGSLARRTQTDVARELGVSDAEIAATATRPLRKEDMVVDWARPASEIANLVRSLAPQPLARTADAQGETLKLAATHVLERGAAASAVVLQPQAFTPQAVFAPDSGRLVLTPARSGWIDGAAVDAGDAWLVLDRVVPAGKGPMEGVRYAQMLRDRMQRETQPAGHAHTAGEKA
jgi:methionyl-tRNA formyltransferase